MTHWYYKQIGAESWQGRSTHQGERNLGKPTGSNSAGILRREASEWSPTFQSNERYGFQEGRDKELGLKSWYNRQPCFCKNHNLTSEIRIK